MCRLLSSPRPLPPLFSRSAVALFLVVLLLFMLTPSQVQAMEMWGRWSGTYYYNDGRRPVSFTFEVNNPGTYFSGQITEENTFGNSNARFLYSYFEGQIWNNGQVQFTKQYDGTAQVGHAVVYNGQLQPNGRTIQGTWRVGNAWGQFILNME